MCMGVARQYCLIRTTQTCVYGCFAKIPERQTLVCVGVARWYLDFAVWCVRRFATISGLRKLVCMGVAPRISLRDGVSYYCKGDHGRFFCLIFLFEVEGVLPQTSPSRQVGRVLKRY